jgi:hypothetical protein
MSRKLIAALCLLTATNVMASIISISSPSRGEPSKAAPSKSVPSKSVPSKSVPSKGGAATTKYQQFIRDPDFNRAVRDIVQECTVNVDMAKLEC